tara:strand:- start:628 stop:972 length:345 start_codon:yes stop_codon:yes gene_type:complete
MKKSELKKLTRIIKEELQKIIDKDLKFVKQTKAQQIRNATEESHTPKHTKKQIAKYLYGKNMKAPTSSELDRFEEEKRGVARKGMFAKGKIQEQDPTPDSDPQIYRRGMGFRKK